MAGEPRVKGRIQLGAASRDGLTVITGERTVAPELDAAMPALRRRGWLMRRLLLIADLVGLLSAFLLALVLVSPNPAVDVVNTRWEVALFVASLPLWVLLARMHGLYDRDEERTDHSTVDDIFGVLQMVSIGTWGFVAVTEIIGLPHPNLTRLVVFWAIAIVLIPLLRAVARVLGRRNAAYIQNVIIVGSGQVARLLANKIGNHPEYGLKIVGFVDRDGRASPANGNQPLDLLGSTSDLAGLVKAHSVHRVAIAFSTDSHEQTLAVIRSIQDSDVQIDIVPRMFEVLGTNAQLHTIEGIPLVGLPIPQLSDSERFLKRSFDTLGAAAGLILLSPLLLIASISIAIDSRGPILFRQVRMGAHGRTFHVLKFRTMVHDAESRKADVAHMNMHRDADARMFKVPSDPRVTRVGAFLRRWRIDELPQLINVIRGEMSIVGPRPLILDEDQHVEAWARKRLDLKPGMTGLWQVLGASDIPFER